MKLALVTPEHPGCGPSHGIGAYVAGLRRVASAAGIVVRVAVANGHGRWLLDGDGTVRECQPWRRPEFLVPRLAASWLARVCAGCDVVEVPNYGGLGAHLAGPWRLVVRLSTPLALVPAEDLLRALVRPLRHRAEQATVARADRLIADSRAMAAVCAEFYGRTADAIIPHAYDGPRSARTGTGKAALFVGRLEARKGVDILIRAWPAVLARHPDAELHLVGNDRGGFAAPLLAAHGAAGIRVHGPLPDAALAELRARCPLVVVPSRFESFGLVVLEAWAAGQAVVAAAGGALPEVVDGAGVVVPVDDATALAAAVSGLFDDPAAVASLVAAGAQRLDRRHAPATWLAASRACWEDGRLSVAQEGASVADGHARR